MDTNEHKSIKNFNHGLIVKIRSQKSGQKARAKGKGKEQGIFESRILNLESPIPVPVSIRVYPGLYVVSVPRAGAGLSGVGWIGVGAAALPEEALQYCYEFGALPGHPVGEVAGFPGVVLEVEQLGGPAAVDHVLDQFEAVVLDRPL